MGKPSLFGHRGFFSRALICGAILSAAVTLAYQRSDITRNVIDDIAFGADANEAALGSSSIFSLPLDLFECHPRLVKRGFGGGTVRQLLIYLNLSLLPGSLKRILVYAGENDIVYGNSVDHTIVQLQVLATKLAQRFQRAHIVIIKPKLAPARLSHHPELLALNQAIENLAQFPRVTVIGSPLSEVVLPQYYLADGVHLSREGYRLLLRNVPKKC